jgi:hypothetical protein
MNKPFLYASTAVFVTSLTLAEMARNGGGIAPEKMPTFFEAAFAVTSPKFDGRVNHFAVATWTSLALVGLAFLEK